MSEPDNKPGGTVVLNKKEPKQNRLDFTILFGPEEIKKIHKCVDGGCYIKFGVWSDSIKGVLEGNKKKDGTPMEFGKTKVGYAFFHPSKGKGKSKPKDGGGNWL